MALLNQGGQENEEKSTEEFAGASRIDQFDPSIHISKASAVWPAMVQRWRNGRIELALNYRDLEQEAMCAIVQEACSRWQAYWSGMEVHAAMAREATNNLNKVMVIVGYPSPHYPCPPELAAKAIWPTQTSPFVAIEAARVDSERV